VTLFLIKGFLQRIKLQFCDFWFKIYDSIKFP